jgi:hypothetical protein
VDVALSFEQAAIKVEKEREFAELRDAITRIFAPDKVERFLDRLRKESVRIRDFDSVLAVAALEQADQELSKSGKSARQWYQELTTSDQAQLREFYLFKVEEVDPTVRAKYQKLYRYY